MSEPAYINPGHRAVRIHGPDRRPVTVHPWAMRTDPSVVDFKGVTRVEGEHFEQFVPLGMLARFRDATVDAPAPHVPDATGAESTGAPASDTLVVPPATDAPPADAVPPATDAPPADVPAPTPTDVDPAAKAAADAALNDTAEETATGSDSQDDQGTDTNAATDTGTPDTSADAGDGDGSGAAPEAPKTGGKRVRRS